MKTVNCWWENFPQERYWLAGQPLDERRDLLEVPDESRKDVASWVSNLVAYLPPRDVIFHFDRSAHAITSWSRAKSPPQRRELGWSFGGDREASRRATWEVKLRDRRMLDAPITVEEIARVQWDLFPALRALEDRVGDPIYYPFALGSPDETHMLPGRFFKLPALFVESFPALSAAASASPAAKSGPARAGASSWWEALEGFLTEHPKEAAPRAR
jgi:hypothetical protein